MAAKKLRDLQESIQSAVLAFQHRSMGPQIKELLISEVNGVSAFARIGIYQDAYEIRITNSLNEDFFRVIDKIGQEQFDLIVNEFLGQYRSEHSNLQEVSLDFVLFLKVKEPSLALDAFLDWNEIESYARYNFFKQSSLYQSRIQNASETDLARAVVVLNPSVLFAFDQLTDNFEVVYTVDSRSEPFSNDTLFLTLTKGLKQFADFFIKPKTLGEIELFLQEGAFAESETEQFVLQLTKWIKEDFLFVIQNNGLKGIK